MSPPHSSQKSNKQSLDKAVALNAAITQVHRRHGEQALKPASEVPKPQPPLGISTAFPQLDALTGCSGIPQDAITLITGKGASGALTIAYKVMYHAQRAFTGQSAVALLDLSNSANVSYIERCGVVVAEEVFLLVRPQSNEHAVDILRDVIRDRQFRVVVVDSLADLNTDKNISRRFNHALPSLKVLLEDSGCSLIVIDDPNPIWLSKLPIFSRSPTREAAALQIQLNHEKLLKRGDRFIGYRAQAKVLPNRWSRGGSTSIEVVFNGTVRASPVL